MDKIILKVEIGDWDGGHNGRYPKIIEWNLNDGQYPIQESEGWGHGLGGGRSTIHEFIKNNKLDILKNGDSDWAYKIIKKFVESGSSVKVIGQALSMESKTHKVILPENLRVVLVRWGYDI